LWASIQLTLITGIRSRPQLSGAAGQAPAAAQASHSSNVTSNLDTAIGCASVTSCCGRSRPVWLPSNSGSDSLSGAPMTNVPAGTTTIAGQPAAHSVNSEPGFAAFSWSIVSTAAPIARSTPK
jgi:hypothetical protein